MPSVIFALNILMCVTPLESVVHDDDCTTFWDKKGYECGEFWYKTQWCVYVTVKDWHCDCGRLYFIAGHMCEVMWNTDREWSIWQRTNMSLVNLIGFAYDVWSSWSYTYTGWILFTVAQYRYSYLSETENSCILLSWNSSHWWFLIRTYM